MSATRILWGQLFFVSIADTAGYSGLEDQVDNHWKEVLGAAALSTLLGVGSEPGAGADSRLQHGCSSSAAYGSCKLPQ